MPSNGTDGAIFESQFCDQCFSDKGRFTGNPEDKSCGIYMKAMCGEQPEEWIIEDGSPKCTSFIKFDWEQSIKDQENRKPEEEKVINDPNQLKLL